MLMSILTMPIIKMGIVTFILACIWDYIGDKLLP